MPDAIIDVLLQWANNTIDRAPELFVLAVVAYDLRKNLLDCTRRNNELIDRLLKRFLDEDH